MKNDDHPPAGLTMSGVIGVFGVLVFGSVTVGFVTCTESGGGGVPVGSGGIIVTLVVPVEDVVCVVMGVALVPETLDVDVEVVGGEAGLVDAAVAVDAIDVVPLVVLVFTITFTVGAVVFGAADMAPADEPEFTAFVMLPAREAAAAASPD